jgi:hypothetical protein
VGRIGAELKPTKRAFLAKPASRKQGWEAAGKQILGQPRRARGDRGSEEEQASTPGASASTSRRRSHRRALERAVNRVFDLVNVIDDFNLRRQQIERVTTLLDELDDSAS